MTPFFCADDSKFLEEWKVIRCLLLPNFRSP